MLESIGRPEMLALSSFPWSSGILGALSLALAATLVKQCRCTRSLRALANQAVNAKAEFLANMSHELRTPLNGILGVAEIIEQTELDADQQELTAVLKSSAASLLRIVNDILDFSRMECGDVRLDSTEFDIRAMVSEVGDFFAPRAQAKGLRFGSAIAAEVPEKLVGDPARVRQVLFNLVDNAVKFTPAGEVRMELAVTGDRTGDRGVLFRVVDSGIGVHQGLLEIIFRPFAQADTSSTRRYGGTGLGLALSHRLVALMGGALNVESHVGTGSTFWFLLPLVEARKPADCEKRILVVDDNPVNQFAASRAVEKLGYVAEVAAGGEPAAEAAARTDFAAILMDCQMPGVDGYQAAAEIRARELEDGGHRTPIIGLTANASEGDPDRCFAAGMDDYLPKPLKISALSAALQRWTGEPEEIKVPAATPVRESPTLPDRASGRSPIRLPVRPLRDESPIFAGWRSFAHSLYRNGFRRDAIPSRRIDSPTGAGNSA
ncbi:MAG TPA: ATP-binding protein [Bryobacteraceae bacterium]|nr:ATP-binding protein [Bryobacteraceae bacterium]